MSWYDCAPRSSRLTHEQVRLWDVYVLEGLKVLHKAAVAVVRSLIIALPQWQTKDEFYEVGPTPTGHR